MGSLPTPNPRDIQTMHASDRSALLAALLSEIKPVDLSLAPAGQAHLDNLTKPQGSLGRLEELALRLFMLSGGRTPAASPARLYVMAGDHGVVAEGVSPYPQEVTRQMILNFLAGGAGINVLCRQAGVDLRVVDAGVAGGTFEPHPALIQAKVRPGSGNIATGPAMSREECLQALLLGADLARQAADEGIRALGTGEMGIGNTTPSTALYCAFLKVDPEHVTGPGAGLNADGVRRKAQVVRRALEANAQAVASGDALDILAALGGLEIAALAGLILGAASRRVMVAVDGFIATAAALSAVRLAPACADALLFSHASAEPAHRMVLESLGQKPLLDLGLRLGEGTGAAMALFLLRSAAAVYNEMATFDSAGVSNTKS